eukprot:scaffold659_cov329-Prasinococcus_capsulatus_cf.AAC.6
MEEITWHATAIGERAAPASRTKQPRCSSAGMVRRRTSEKNERGVPADGALAAAVREEVAVVRVELRARDHLHSCSVINAQPSLSDTRSAQATPPAARAPSPKRKRAHLGQFLHVGWLDVHDVEAALGGQVPQVYSEIIRREVRLVVAAGRGTRLQ